MHQAFHALDASSTCNPLGARSHHPSRTMAATSRISVSAMRERRVAVFSESGGFMRAGARGASFPLADRRAMMRFPLSSFQVFRIESGQLGHDERPVLADEAIVEPDFPAAGVRTLAHDHIPVDRALV